MSLTARSPVASFLAVAVFAASPSLHAQITQSLEAQVDGSTFQSDDDGITFIPVMGNFSLSASTKGASAYPPPTSRIDRLAIVCRPFEAGETKTFTAIDFGNSGCDVTFTVGTRPMGGEPDASFHLDKSSGENRFEIAAARGKIIEGTFQFDLKDDQGKQMTVRNGRFVAEDRQY